MTQQIYVRADEYYHDIDLLQFMIRKEVARCVENIRTSEEISKTLFEGIEYSASPSTSSPQVLRLDDSDIVNPEDVVVGIDNCWVKIELYAADMWAVYTNAYSEIMTTDLLTDSVKDKISTELDGMAHFNEFVDDMSLLEIRRYLKD